jgi:hypothetical protein
MGGSKPAFGDGICAPALQSACLRQFVFISANAKTECLNRQGDIPGFPSRFDKFVSLRISGAALKSPHFLKTAPEIPSTSAISSMYELGPKNGCWVGLRRLGGDRSGCSSRPAASGRWDFVHSRFVPFTKV